MIENLSYSQNRLEDKTVTLVFKRDQLIPEIAHLAYVEGDLIKTDDEHDRHNIQDMLEDGNNQHVTRKLDQAFLECQDMLYPYSKQDIIDGASGDNVYTVTNDYILTLIVPSDFSQTTFELLKTYIHDYMISYVMQDWMSITNPDKFSMQNWASKILEVKEKIATRNNTRTHRIRRTMSPF